MYYKVIQRYYEPMLHVFSIFTTYSISSINVRICKSEEDLTIKPHSPKSRKFCHNLAQFKTLSIVAQMIEWIVGRSVYVKYSMLLRQKIIDTTCEIFLRIQRYVYGWAKPVRPSFLSKIFFYTLEPIQRAQQIYIIFYTRNEDSLLTYTPDIPLWD